MTKSSSGRKEFVSVYSSHHSLSLSEVGQELKQERKVEGGTEQKPRGHCFLPCSSGLVQTAFTAFTYISVPLPRNHTAHCGWALPHPFCPQGNPTEVIIQPRFPLLWYDEIWV